MIYVCVEIVCGVVDKLSAFSTWTDALGYFRNIVDDFSQWYEVNVGTVGAHAIDNEDGDYEIYIDRVEIDSEVKV